MTPSTGRWRSASSCWNGRRPGSAGSELPADPERRRITGCEGGTATPGAEGASTLLAGPIRSKLLSGSRQEA